MKHTEAEVKKWIWLQQQFYKCGLRTTKQIADLESVKGWTWDKKVAPPTGKLRKRIIREVLNSYLHPQTTAQIRAIRRIYHRGAA
jgi:hypothetical protein